MRIVRMMPYAFLGVLGASLFLNVLLGYRLFNSAQLQEPVQQIEARTHQRIPTLSLTQADGRPFALQSSGDKPTLIYLFSPHCAWCARNADSTRSLAAQLDQRVRMVAISVEGGTLMQFAKTHSSSMPMYAITSDADLKLLDFRGTPQTVLLNKDGVVIHNWPGAYMGSTARSIEKSMTVVLPPLSSSQPAYSLR